MDDPYVQWYQCLTARVSAWRHDRAHCHRTSALEYRAALSLTRRYMSSQPCPAADGTDAAGPIRTWRQLESQLFIAEAVQWSIAVAQSEVTPKDAWFAIFGIRGQAHRSDIGHPAMETLDQCVGTSLHDVSS